MQRSGLKGARCVNGSVNGALVGSTAYPTAAVQCPPGTMLEIGDGWASGDSRRWAGEMQKFVLYSEPKTADEVAMLYAASSAAAAGH